METMSLNITLISVTALRDGKHKRKKGRSMTYLVTPFDMCYSTGKLNNFKYSAVYCMKCNVKS